MSRFLIYGNADDVAIVPHFRQDGFWESWITLATAKLVQPGWKCVNVGANLGYYSLLLAALSGEEVHAFEPIQRTADLLRRTVAENKLPITVHQLAVGSGAVEVAMGFDPARLCNAVVGAQNPIQELVKCVRLDDVIERADLIFIDADCSEAEIMAGAERLISEGARVIVEVNPLRTYPAGWLDSLAKRWPLRWLDFNGNISPLPKLIEEVMLYLGP